MQESKDKPHLPVLPEEVSKVFEPLNIVTFIDATLGAGGHAQLLLSQHEEIQQYIGIDQDTVALSLAKDRLKDWKNKISLMRGNFVDVIESLIDEYEGQIDGVLMDLGVSSMQLDTPDRGFSFQKPGPLDMRMDKEGPVTAKDIVNTWEEEKLSRLFRDFGEEKSHRAIAKAICKAREITQIETTTELASIISPCVRNKKPGIHPATKTFQALRLAVNKELDVIEKTLPLIIKLLKKKGRCAVISFHSLEDRIVKRYFRYAASDKEETTGIGGVFRDKKREVKLLFRKPQIAKESEKRNNPRSRSARLRAVEKL